MTVEDLSGSYNINDSLSLNNIITQLSLSSPPYIRISIFVCYIMIYLLASIMASAQFVTMLINSLYWTAILTFIPHSGVGAMQFIV